MIQIKRAYDAASPDDGYRVLVERFWPRDLDEKHAKLDQWLKEVAPSAELHTASGENPDPSRWEEFRQAYWSELRDKHRAIKLLRDKSKEAVLTLVHAAHNPDHSSAAVLKAYLDEAAGSVKT